MRAFMSAARTDTVSRTAMTFTALALGFAWLYWLAVVLWRKGVLPFSMESGDFFPQSVLGAVLWAILSNFGPAIAGFIAVGRGAPRLARSIIQWRIPARLYVLGLFGLGINLGVVIAGVAAGQLRFAPQVTVAKAVLVFFPMVFLDGPFGEEIGWRGVLLPELLQRFSALTAALLVGVVWYLWHVPLYLVSGRMTDLGAHVEFLYSCLALSILFTWFFLKSAGSTFLAIYLHAFSNYFTFLRVKLFVRSGPPTLLLAVYVILLSAMAIVAAIALSRRRLVS